MPDLSKSGADQPTYGMEEKPFLLIISLDNLSSSTWSVHDFARGVYADEFCIDDDWYRKALIQTPQYLSDDIVEFFDVVTSHLLSPKVISSVSPSGFRINNRSV